MTFAGVNLIGVLIAAVASFVFGALWYGALLQKQWLRASGKTEADVAAQGGRPLLMSLTFLAEVVMALMLAGVIGHLGAQGFTIANGVITGASIWLGFVITSTAVNYGFQGAKPALTAIDSGHWLAVLAIQGAILGLMGV